MRHVRHGPGVLPGHGGPGVFADLGRQRGPSGAVARPSPFMYPVPSATATFLGPSATMVDTAYNVSAMVPDYLLVTADTESSRTSANL